MEVFTFASWQASSINKLYRYYHGGKNLKALQDERSANVYSSLILQWFSQRFKTIGILHDILGFPINEP
jgi:hypothetical protein